MAGFHVEAVSKHVGHEVWNADTHFVHSFPSVYSLSFVSRALNAQKNKTGTVDLVAQVSPETPFSFIKPFGNYRTLALNPAPTLL